METKNHFKLSAVRKFGAFGGVFTPSILTILGVIMYLRLPWIVGHAGLWATLGIILVAHIISLSTGLSVASVATDKKVETGGSYFIISRSLGLPIGGTLGLALFVGLSFSVSLYLIGFAETFLSYFGFEVSLLTIRIAGSAILFVVALVTFISTSLAIKTQYIIMTAMVLSLVSVFFGNHDHVPSTPLFGSITGAMPWIALFAIFFPAVTGFEAGVSMSGDLKDARKDIPTGTIAAILVGLVVYIGLAIFFSYTVDRHLLVNDPRVLFQISLVPQLVIAGILGATLSSALGSILGAPRILQAIASDKIIPRFFAKGFGLSNEPRNALLLTYLIAQAGILIGELNVIARIVTIFFIITYGFLNITYAIESWAGSDFRPSFKIPRFVSIIGALACIIVMIQLDIIAFLAASAVLTGLFVFLKRQELTLQTGDTWNSVWTSLVKSGLGQLIVSNRKLRNWRPNVILFSGGEQNRPHLIEMGKALVGKLGIFTNFEIIENPGADPILRDDTGPDDTGPNLKKPGVFTRRHHCRNFYEGIDLISRVYGFSGFEPNTILMGWGSRTRDPLRFSSLIETFKKQNFNCVFLAYNPHAKFGNYKQIDFWWTNSGRNLSFAITLLRYIASGKEWMNAKIRIMVINQDNSQTETLYHIVYQLLDRYRIAAAVRVINNGIENLPEEVIIKAHSSQTDLTIIELPETGKQYNAGMIEITSAMVAQLKTCLLIRSSSHFDDLNFSPRLQAEEADEQLLQTPHSSVLTKLNTASREIIANEVYNAGQALEGILLGYAGKAFDSQQNKLNDFFSELSGFSEKILDQLQKTIKSVNHAERPKAFLRILNDFSYHSQKRILDYKSALIEDQKAHLEKANEALVSDLHLFLSSTPEFLRIKLLPSDFVIKDHDTWFGIVKKRLQKIYVKTTGRSIYFKLRLSQSVNYFLFFKRIESASELLKKFAFTSLGKVAGLRKILSDLHELIEFARLETEDSGNQALVRISHERSKIMAQIASLETQAINFRLHAGNSLLSDLLVDLQQFSDYLDKTESDGKIRKQLLLLRKKTKEQEEEFNSLAAAWGKNIELFLNKAILDFILLWLRSRIDSKIRKYHHDFFIIPEKQIFRPFKSFIEVVQKARDTNFLDNAADLHLDPGLLKSPGLLDFYSDLFAEIKELFAEMPEKMEIGSMESAERIDKGELSEPDPVEVDLRKITGFYLSNLLIDRMKTIGRETENQIQQCLIRTKDLVKLINFSLSSDNYNPESNEEVLDREKTVLLFQEFLSGLSNEEQQIRNILENFYRSFDKGLNLAFEPLSSALLSQTSHQLKQKIQIKGQSRFRRLLNHQFDKCNKVVQEGIVNLLYSKSKGIVWASQFEDSQTAKLSNRDMLTFVGAITPHADIIRELPYFYSTLFSGLSGTSIDFWVGMEAQIEEGGQAIRRFHAGHQGAIIITGQRSSGKSSLSKYLARQHFNPDKVHFVKGPKSSQASILEFRNALIRALRVQAQNIDDLFNALPAGKAIVIHDLELWWERKPGGLQVIDQIKDLIDKYGRKVLFIINVNEYALKVIDKATGLLNYSLATMVCKPFDARQMREIIMLRHAAGGLKFVYNKKEETKLTALDYASIFNRYFDQSFGNPGLLISLWLASIKKITARTLIMKPVELPSTHVFDLLSQEQLFCLLQFVMHRRLTVEALARSLQLSEHEIKKTINNLIRSGIITERFEGVYAIEAALDLFIVEILKSKNLL